MKFQRAGEIPTADVECSEPKLDGVDTWDEREERPTVHGEFSRQHPIIVIALLHLLAGLVYQL